MSRIIIEKYQSISANVDRTLPSLVGLKITPLTTHEITHNGIAKSLVIDPPPNKAEFNQCQHVINLVAEMNPMLDNPQLTDIRQLMPTNTLDNAALFGDFPRDEFGEPMHLLAQLNNRMLGSTSYRQSCDICIRNSTTCRGHGTHHALYWPIQDPVFTKTALHILKFTCYFCVQFKSREFAASLAKHAFHPAFDITGIQEGEIAKWLVNQRDWFYELQQTVQYDTCPLICDHCGMPQPNYVLLQPDRIGIQWDVEFVNAWRTNHLGQKLIQDWLRVASETLGLRGSINSLNNMSELLSALKSAPLKNDIVTKRDRRWLELSIQLLNDSEWRVYLSDTIYTSANVRSILEYLDDKNVWLFGYDPRMNHPLNMIMTHLPIVTSAIRPQSMDVESGLTQTIGHMKKTQDVLTRSYIAITQLSAHVRVCLIASKVACARKLKALLKSGDTYKPEYREQMHACALWLTTPLYDLWRLTCETRAGSWAAAHFLYKSPVATKIGFLQAIINVQHEIDLMIDTSSTMKGNVSTTTTTTAVATSAPTDEQNIHTVDAIIPSRRHNTARTGARVAANLASNSTLNVAKRATSVNALSEKNALKKTPDARARVAHLAWCKNNDIDLEQDVIEGAQLHNLKCLCCLRTYSPRHDNDWQTPQQIDQNLYAWMIAAHHHFSRTRGGATNIVVWLNANLKPNTHMYSNQKIPAGRLEVQNAKEGRILGELVGKRVDFSARLVFSANNTVRVGALKLPLSVIASQFKLIVVHDYNLTQLVECVRRGANRIGGAAAVITDKNHIIWLKGNAPPSTIVLQCGWRVLIYLQRGDFVLVNRQPTLQKASMNAHAIDYIDVESLVGDFWSMVDANTAQFSEDATDPYNFDFDGDVGAIMFPVQLSSRVEITFMSNISNNYICPRTHQPIFRLKQSGLFGIWMLTQSYTWLKRDEMQLLISHMRGILPRHLLKHVATRPIHLRQASAITNHNDCYSNHYRSNHMRWPIELPPPANTSEQLWSGRQLLELILPSDMCYTKGEVVIKNGKWMNGNSVKSIFNGAKSIFHHLWLYYSKQYAVDAQSECGMLGSTYLEKIRGLTCGLEDLEMGGNRAMLNTPEFGNFDSARKIRLHLSKCVNNAYSHLGAQISQHGELLCESQVRVLYDYIQLKSESMVLALGNLHVALTDELKNQVMLMSNRYAGSKGSVANAVAVGGAVGFLKSNMLTAGANLNSQRRRTTYDCVGERTLKTAGFINTPFLDGLSGQELSTSNMKNRLAIYDSSELDLPGYQQKRYNKHIGSEAICYDGTVRNGIHAIIQLCYGGNGYDPSFAMKVLISGKLLSGGLNTETNELRVLIGNLTETLLNSIELRPYYDYKSRAHFLNNGFNCLVPVDVRDLFDQIYNMQQSQRTFIPLDELALEYFVRVTLRNYTLTTCDPIEFQLHVLDVILTNWLIKKNCLSANDFEHLLERIGELYIQRKYEPGSAVGGNAAQNLSADAAQIKLRTFNPVATTEGGVQYVSNGMKQWEEILTVTKAKSEANNMTRVVLNPQWVSNKDALDFWIQNNVSCTLNQIALPGRVHSVDLTCASPSAASIHPQHNLWPILFGSIVASQPLQLLEHISTIGEYPIITFELKEIVCIEQFKNMTDLEFVLMRGLLPWQRGCLIGGSTIAPKCPYYWCIWAIYLPDDIEQWLSHGRTSPIWVRHTQTLRELAKALYMGWQICGEYGIERCASVTAPIDKTPAAMTLTPPQITTNGTVKLYVNRLLHPDTRVAHSDLVWLKRIWPNVRIQLEQRQSAIHHIGLTVEYFDDEDVILGGKNANGQLFSHVLNSRAHLGAILQYPNGLREVIVMLKSPATLVREGLMRDTTDMANVGVKLPRIVMCHLGAYEHMSRVQIISNHPYTELLVKDQLSSLVYFHQDELYAKMHPLGDKEPVTGLSGQVKMELWQAEDFYYNWWSHRLNSAQTECAILPFMDDAARRDLYEREFGRIVTATQDMAQFIRALPTFDNHGIINRRYGILPDGTLMLGRRSNHPKVNAHTAHIICRASVI